jgi:hypothetical protein
MYINQVINSYFFIIVFLYRCPKIREFRIQSVVGKDLVELEKKIRSSEEDISTLILFNT